MKRKSLFSFFAALIVAAFVSSLYAQDTLIFDPSLLTPSDTGYYVKGYDKTEGTPPVVVHYDSCSNEFQESHHFEADTLEGFYFQNGMVMPTCPSKNTPSNVSLGYMQLGKSMDLGTATEKLCALTFPPVQNLISIYLEVSPDNSPIPAPDPNERHIYFYVEYSKDNGDSWQVNKIHDETLDKAGDKHTYDAAGSFTVFNEMKTASETGPIVIRVFTDPQPGLNPQRLRIHKAMVIADKVSSLTDYITDNEFITVLNGVIISKTGTVKVYNIHGQLIGSGDKVSVKNGIYIVASEDGRTQKVMVH
ncbi:MAG: hypothetical protein JXB00_00430 [Bacteroidales bacterium]|nr:hypothetical protein [Bacteroidales bacterium]